MSKTTAAIEAEDGTERLHVRIASEVVTALRVVAAQERKTLAELVEQSLRATYMPTKRAR